MSSKFKKNTRLPLQQSKMKSSVENALGIIANIRLKQAKTDQAKQNNAYIVPVTTPKRKNQTEINKKEWNSKLL